MSKTVHIESPGQFSTLISSSAIVVADFYADWCGPCKAIAPLYEQLSSQLSRPNKITFTKINTDHQQQIAQSYKISAMPTFLVFKTGREVSRVRGADAAKLSEVVKKLAAEADSTGTPSGGFGETSGSRSASGASWWRGAELPRGYTDVTDEVDGKGLDLLNADNELGGVRTLFEGGKPSAIGEGKGKGDKADWVESDTDEQLMLYIPFQATLKIHTLHITSLPPATSTGDKGGEEVPMRPKTIKLYTNQAHNLGFEEAEDMAAVQEIVLKGTDWNAKTGTARVELRFVKFQKVTSLVVFVVDGEGGGERVRIDRLRIIGDTGEKRTMGKLEKIGDETE